MRVTATPIDGLYAVDTEPFIDNRGAFARFYCARELSSVTGGQQIAQINFSKTRSKATIRGIHFQYPPHAEQKLVRCIRGAVFDVCVDLRASSPTFLQYHAEELTSENARMLVIPAGCAHGFQALEQDSEILYLVSEFYHPAAEDCIRFDDPAIGVTWPLPATEMTDRDRDAPLLDADFAGLKM